MQPFSLTILGGHKAQLIKRAVYAFRRRRISLRASAGNQQQPNAKSSTMCKAQKPKHSYSTGVQLYRFAIMQSSKSRTIRQWSFIRVLYPLCLLGLCVSQIRGLDIRSQDIHKVHCQARRTMHVLKQRWYSSIAKMAGVKYAQPRYAVPLCTRVLQTMICIA